MTITGTGFAGATAVRFNGVDSTNVASVTPTSIKATVPPGATSGPIAVVNPSGSGASAGTFAITLAITSFSPTSGPVGTTVVIQGSGFDKAVGVKFGDLTASGSIDSATQITAVVPQGAVTGPITVGTGALSVSSALPFTVTLPVIVDVGTLGGNLCTGFSSPYSSARAISEDGDVAGESCKLVGIQNESHPFLWTDDAMTDPGTFGTAYGINDAGRVVGGTGAQFSDFSGNAFVWSGGTFTSLGPALGGFSRAFDINSAGKVVGYRGTPPALDSWSAFVYDTGTSQVTTLAGLGGASAVPRTRSTSRGRSPGMPRRSPMPSMRCAGAEDSARSRHAQGRLRFGRGINAAGDVVGRSNTSDGTEHAFLYSGGSMDDLGTLGGPRGTRSGSTTPGTSSGGRTPHPPAALRSSTQRRNGRSQRLPAPGFWLGVDRSVGDQQRPTGRRYRPEGRRGARLPAQHVCRFVLSCRIA